VTTELEVELATFITRAIPFIEKIRFVSSGTEATMSAVRLARGVTKRNFIVKFEGCYHGHADSFLSQAGSGLATLGIAECPGVPAALAALTLNVAYNDLHAVERVFLQHKDKIAAIIVEPIAANMGVVPPQTGFLKGLHEITKKNGALLIVDEVITGFVCTMVPCRNFWESKRISRHSGKSSVAGVPVAAYGGRAELMDHVAPLGPVYQAGHARGKPAGDEGWYCCPQTARKAGVGTRKMTQLARRLVFGLRAELADAGIPAQINAIGSLSTVFFTPGPVRNYADAKRSDTKRYAKFFREMLDRGVFLAPSQFEAAFVSAAHTSQDIDRTLAAAHESLQTISSDSAV